MTDINTLLKRLFKFAIFYFIGFFIIAIGAVFTLQKFTQANQLHVVSPLSNWQALSPLLMFASFLLGTCAAVIALIMTLRIHQYKSMLQEPEHAGNVPSQKEMRQQINTLQRLNALAMLLWLSAMGINISLLV